MARLHPSSQSFADVETAITNLPGSFFFLEGDEEAVDVLRSVVISLDGRPVPLDSASKALYHAAACAASNFLVTLVDYAASLMTKAGVPPDVAIPALLPLVAGTVRNLEAVGIPEALTGPISRGDIGTVRNHLAALRKAPGDLVRLYVALARKTVEVALRKGRIERQTADAFLTLLSGDDPASSAGGP